MAGVVEVARLHARLAGDGVTLHDVQRVIKQLRVWLGLESDGGPRGVVDVGGQVALVTGGWTPDVLAGLAAGVRGVQGGGVRHRVGGGHGGLRALVVHALRHEVVGVVSPGAGGPIVAAILLGEVEVGANIGLGAALLPVAIMKAPELSALVTRDQTSARGCDLVETVLENLVKMHRVLSSSHRIHPSSSSIKQ